VQYTKEEIITQEEMDRLNAESSAFYKAHPEQPTPMIIVRVSQNPKFKSGDRVVVLPILPGEDPDGISGETAEVFTSEFILGDTFGGEYVTYITTKKLGDRKILIPIKYLESVKENGNV
jgi:hypothetical protein